MEKKIALQIDVFGVVQGVGFRPYLYNQLNEKLIKGTIQNRGDSVRLTLEASRSLLEVFVRDMKQHIPPQAKVDRLVVNEIPISNFTDLTIIESEKCGPAEISIPEDLPTCPDCFDEFFSSTNRRYHYPFIACTNCGPRYTVVTGVPYDRVNTTLVKFPLCVSCHREYIDPANRRFHAESMACVTCGPTLWLYKRERLPIRDVGEISDYLTTSLKKGEIIAIRSLGGFQLICDARNSDALLKLRQRKGRPRQSFALLARDISVLSNEVFLSEKERELLTGTTKPAVILKTKEICTLPMNLIAPDLNTLGIMLPTTPIHSLLFGLKGACFDFLVATSGNAHGEPIAISNNEALERLSGIADLFLFHDREINRRADDSIATVIDGKSQIWRQGRGTAPMRHLTSKPTTKNILALGAELKNSITLAYDNKLITSPHIGSLTNSETASAFIEMCEKIPEFYDKKIEAIAVDLHPSYFSSTYGAELANKLKIPLLKIQHHHAHAAAVMAEYELEDSVAIVCDGTGFGSDGTIWGGELLYVSQNDFTRLGHLAPFPLVGAESAIKNPWKIVAGILDHPALPTLFNKTGSEIALLKMAAQKKLNSPLTSSMGRLFDAASAILGICLETTYEGEAAIRLEKEAHKSQREGTPLTHNRASDTKALLNELLLRKLSGENRPDLAYAFHESVAQIILAWALHGRSLHPDAPVTLSGGVFQNRLLMELTCELLKKDGITPLFSQKYPPGDGAISFGQAVVAKLKITS